MKRIMNLQMFAAPTGTIVSTDVEPAISIDFTNRLATNIVELQNVLGVTNMIPMAAGTLIKMDKTTVANSPAQVAEGEDIALTEIKRELAGTVELKLKGLSKGELDSVLRAVGSLEKLIDPKAKGSTADLIKYLGSDEEKKEKLLEEPSLLAAPIVRNGRQATVGYCPEVWSKWE